MAYTPHDPVASPHLHRGSRYRLGFSALVFSLSLWCLSCRAPQATPAQSDKSSLAAHEHVSGGPPSYPNLSMGIDLSREPGTRYEVTYADGVIRIGADKVHQMLIGASREHDIYIFRNEPALRASLQPGRVVLFEGLSAKKIQAIAEDGTRLIVGLEDAPLTQVFKEADIRWKTPINFLEIHNRQAQFLTKDRNTATEAWRWSWLSPQPVFAEEQNAEEEGWHIKHDVTFTPDRADFQVDLTQSGELEATLSGKGYIKNFQSTLALTIQNNQVNQFDFSNKDMNGSVDFNWTVGAPGKPPKFGEEQLKLPSLMSVPLYVGGMPFTLEIGEALLFHPAFSAKEEIAKGGFHVDYNGVTGLSVSQNGGAPSEQNTSNATSDSSIQSSKAFSPMAAFGVVIAVAMPRFELKTGTEEFLPPIPDSLADRAAELLEKTTLGHFVKKAKESIKTEAAGTFQVILSTTASHSGMLSLVPCQRFTLHVEGQVSADATLLGIPKELLKTKTIFKKDIDQPIPNAKICTG